MNIIIRLKPTHRSFDAVVEELRQFGFIPDRKLPGISVVTGAIDRKRASELERHPEVAALEEDQTYQLAPHPQD